MIYTECFKKPCPIKKFRLQICREFSSSAELIVTRKSLKLSAFTEKVQLFVTELYLYTELFAIGLVFLNTLNGANPNTAIALSIGNFAVRNCNSQ
jgi:hypothetical protein